jgi:probable HAF family extracellular repeat protein
MEQRIRHRRRATKVWKLVFLYVLLTMVLGSAPSFAAMQDLGTLGGIFSRAYAINKTGQVAGGSLISSEDMHAFLYSNGTMIDLGTFGGSWTCAYGINDSGQVVGSSETSSLDSRAFLYSKGTMKDLGTLGGTEAYAYAINNKGQIVGQSDTFDGEFHAFLYSNGTMRDLGTLGGSYSCAYGINNSGQIVGESQTSSGDWHAFLYSGGTMIDLGTLGGTQSRARSINNKGQIVGESLTPWRNYHAFLYTNGAMRDLGTLGGENSYAYGINDSGQIAGFSTFTPGTWVFHAFLYSKGTMKDLGTLGGTEAYAHAINKAGQIVGESDTSSGEAHAFRTDPLVTGSYNLAAVSPASTEFALFMDASLNDRADAELCSKYAFQVVTEDTIIPQDACKVVGDAVELPNAKRYRISFDVPPSSETSKTGWFSGGTVQACNLKTDECEELDDLWDITVYGTTFDLRKHAWHVRNGYWKPLSITKTSSDFFKAGDVIDDYISAEGYDDFWCSYMTMPGNDKCPDGLCNGLTQSAIANFTHEDEAAWGTDGTSGKKLNTVKWKEDIEKHWDDVLEEVIGPFKPFQADNIYGSAETWNALDKWTPQAAKKVLYHQVSHPSNRPGSTNWVGRDGDALEVNSSTAEAAVTDLLALGTPVSLTIEMAEGAHQVAITQVLEWSTAKGGGEERVSHARYTLWDPNYPWAVTKSAPYGPYLQWYIDDTSDYPGSFDILDGNLITLLNKKRGTDYGTGYTLDVYPKFLPENGDSQNIYNLAPTKAAGQSESRETPGDESTKVRTSSRNLPRYPNHMEILVVGGTVWDVSEKDTGVPVSLGRDGMITPYQGLLEEGTNDLGVSVTLSSQKGYRIKASQIEGLPGMKVFITIPNPDGTIEKITYDNITANEKETIEFFVGQGNKNLTMKINPPYHGARSRELLPTYQRVLPTRLPPPRNLELIHENNTIRLEWDNTTHPQFEGVRVLRKELTPPKTPDDGVVLYQGTGTNVADSAIEKDKVYCYAVYSMNLPSEASISTNACIDTGKHALSGRVLGYGENSTITLKTEGGRILQHRKAGKDGTYRFNNLGKGNYLIEVRLDPESEPSVAGTVAIDDKDVKMEVR